MVSGAAWGNQAQFNLYQGMLDRSLLTIKYAQALRMEEQLRRVNEKYDGSASQRLEEDVDKLAGERSKISGYLYEVQHGTKRIDEVRTKLLEMRAAVTIGSGDAFDLASEALNAVLGNRKDNPTSLISDIGNGRGDWSERSELYTAASMSVNVDHHFLGNNYNIQLDSDGAYLNPDPKEKILEGGAHSISFANIDSVSITGEAISFRDTATGITHTGTIKSGGLDVLNSWAYENLTTDTGKAAANAALDSAFIELAKYERSFLQTEAQLIAMDKVVKNKADRLTEEYIKVTTEELDAKQAERKAIKGRFELFNNTLALTSGTSSELIYRMFMTSATPAKTSLTDIMFQAAGY